MSTFVCYPGPLLSYFIVVQVRSVPSPANGRVGEQRSGGDLHPLPRRYPRGDRLVSGSQLGPAITYIFIRLFNANVKQVINVTQLVVGKMVADKQPGAVVNVSSQASHAALGDHTVYCATKGALDMVTK